ncbi:MAG: hypothetical protein ACO230_00670 [Ilumatobacteraceae bacterium]
MMITATTYLTGGVSTAIGSLPHRDARAAAEFAVACSPELPSVPSLPKRSPAESMIAQAVVGIRGISLGQYGSLVVDPSQIDPFAPVVTDLQHDAFVGLRAFLDVVAGRTAPVKWQFTGPVTLGLSLVRAGVPVHLAFDVAVRAVRSHVRNIHEHIASVLPDSPQVVFIDEPMVGDIMDESFPIAPDTAIDLMSGAMAALERDCLVGLHSCANIDVAPLLAAGPAVLSVPVSDTLSECGPALAGFLDKGGIVAWGVVATDGPMMNTAERSWKKLSSLWCGLVQNGCDALKLRQQSLVTPACGLALHTEDNATTIMEQVRDIGDRVRTQALATRLTVGA